MSLEFSPAAFKILNLKGKKILKKKCKCGDVFFFLWFKFVFNFPIVRLCPSFRFTTHPEFFFRKNKLPTFVPNFSSRETPAKNPSTIDTAHCIHLFFLFAAISAILLSVPKPIFFYYYYYFLDEIPLPSKYLFSVQYRPGETKTR